MIPYGRQDINQNDIEAVIDVLTSDFLTQGPKVPEFEQKIASYCYAEYGIGVNSCTSALHIACLALGVGPGDEVWTSPITFAASANCALYCGASVDFVDINPDTFNMDVDCLEEKLVEAKREDRLPKVVIPVHFCGQPCDMKKIHELSLQYGFGVIEDASHAIGGRYQGEPIGNCRYSDITVFSFHPVKIITTGEGGIAVTNDSYLAKKMCLLRSHGITRDSDEMTRESEGPWYYQQIDLGFNYRMTDLQAALGISQIDRLDEFVERRHERAGWYNERIAGLPVKAQHQHDWSYSGMHLYVVVLDRTSVSSSHRLIFQRLRESGIGVNLHYIPVYLHPYYRSMGFAEGYCPESEHYYSAAISLPMFPGLVEEQVVEIVNKLEKALSAP